MQKIQYIKNYKGKKAGDTESVGNNVAHGLVQQGVAVLYGSKIFPSPLDKMMRAGRPESRGERRARQRREARAKQGNEYKVK